MTGRCYDLHGPRDQLVVATKHGWMPFDEKAATKMAASAMMLACGPEHFDHLQAKTQATIAKPVSGA
jgi:hypothetical protein